MGLRRLIQRNFWAKFLSFAVAFLVWLSIYTGQGRNQRAETEGKIPVSDGPGDVLQNVPAAPLTPLNPLTPNKPTAANAMVKSDPFFRPVAILKPPTDGYTYEVKPAEIEVVVQGEKEQLKKMDTTEIRVFVDITKVLEKFGTAEQHAGIPVLVKVHTPTTVALASVVPSLASVKRIPPSNPVTKPEPPAVTSQPDIGSSTNSVNAVPAATNGAPPSASVEKGPSPGPTTPQNQENKTDNNKNETGNADKKPKSAPPRDAGKDNE